MIKYTKEYSFQYVCPSCHTLFIVDRSPSKTVTCPTCGKKHSVIKEGK